MVSAKAITIAQERPLVSQLQLPVPGTGHVMGAAAGNYESNAASAAMAELSEECVFFGKSQFYNLDFTGITWLSPRDR
jgi:hypothetical protein